MQASSGAATEKAVEAKPSAPSHALRAKRRRPCPAPDRPDERSPAQEEEVSNRALNMLVRVRTCFVATLSGSPGAALAICSSPNGQQRPFCSPDLCPSPRWCGSLASTNNSPVVAPAVLNMLMVGACLPYGLTALSSMTCVMAKQPCYMSLHWMRHPHPRACERLSLGCTPFWQRQLCTMALKDVLLRGGKASCCCTHSRGPPLEGRLVHVGTRCCLPNSAGARRHTGRGAPWAPAAVEGHPSRRQVGRPTTWQPGKF